MYKYRVIAKIFSRDGEFIADYDNFIFISSNKGDISRTIAKTIADVYGGNVIVEVKSATYIK